MYPECDTCAYRGTSTCDFCEDADQYEPDGSEDDSGPYRYEPGTYPIYMMVAA